MARARCRPSEPVLLPILRRQQLNHLGLEVVIELVTHAHWALLDLRLTAQNLAGDRANDKRRECLSPEASDSFCRLNHVQPLWTPSSRELNKNLRIVD